MNIPDWEQAGIMLHGWNGRFVDKLQGVFETKHDEFIELDDSDEAWTSFLNGHDCNVIVEEDILDDLPHFLNHQIRKRDVVCINDPHSGESGMQSYILVPRDLAEKAVVLGHLP